MLTWNPRVSASDIDWDAYARLNGDRHRLPGLANHMGTSTLGTADIQRYQHGRIPLIGSDSPATGKRWSKMSVGHAVRRPRAKSLQTEREHRAKRTKLQQTYRALRQAQYAREWRATGPHRCACGCGLELAPGSYKAEPKQYARGHNVRLERRKRSGLEA